MATEASNEIEELAPRDHAVVPAGARDVPHVPPLVRKRVETQQLVVPVVATKTHFAPAQE